MSKDAKKKSSKKRAPLKRPTSRQQRAKRIKDFEHIERVWAEKGVVRMLMKDGTHRTKTPLQAEQEIAIVREMPFHESHRRQIELWTEQVEKVILQAKSQFLNPSTTAEKAVTNVLKGLTVEGKRPEEVTTEDVVIERLHFQFPALSRQEIQIILRDQSEGLTAAQKMNLMGGINNERLNDQLYSGKFASDES